MPRIRLLTSVQGDGPVFGGVGDELDVPNAVARVWADGERAELVKPPKTTPVVPPVVPPPVS